MSLKHCGAPAVPLASREDASANVTRRRKRGVASLRARARDREPRKTERTAADWHVTYLAALADNCGQKTAAAKAAGVTVRSVQRHRIDYPEFEKAEADALVIAMETAESEARRRAIDGVERISRKIDKDGTVHEHIERKYSDTILLRLLERLETGSWRKKHQKIEQCPGPAFATRVERKAALDEAREAIERQTLCPTRWTTKGDQECGKGPRDE